MRRATKRLFVLCAALVPGAVFWSPAALAEPAPSSLAVEVEIADQVGGRRDALLVTLTLAGDRGCSSAQVLRESVKHDVQVCREGGDATAPVLAFGIERNESSPHGHSLAKFRFTSRLARGKRVLVGRSVRADGSGTQVTALAR